MNNDKIIENMIVFARKIISQDRDKEKEISTFLYENPFPNQNQFIAFLNEKEMNADEVYEILLKFASKYARLIHGGLSNKMEITEKDVDPDNLAKGIEVELEHTEDEDIARKIALDHLAEAPGTDATGYYDALDEMEKTLEDEYE